MDLWLLLIVMSLATYRLTRLVVEDVFPPVLWVRDRIAGGWRPLSSREQLDYDYWQAQPKELRQASFVVQEIDDVPQRWVTRARWSPDWLADLVSCPWCASGWVALGVTAGVWASVGLAVPLLVWPAVWGAGALLAAQEWA
jgi:hypothetical protein